MSSGSARPDPEQSRHSSHRLERDPAPEAGDDQHDGAWFAVVLRGYDRSQVDTRLAELDRRIHEELRRADSAESALSASRAHVRRLQEQLESGTPETSTLSTVTAGAGDAGFGRRVERVLQAAEQEAAELRDRAAADAEELRERARAETETHRNRTEEALLSRAATLDREFTARSTALDEREREADERLASARDEAAELRTEASAELDRAREEAAELRREAGQEADERRSGIARDVDRLSVLRDEVRAELGRVRESLSAELDREPVAAALDDALFGPSALPETALPETTQAGSDHAPSGPLGSGSRHGAGPDDATGSDNADGPDNVDGPDNAAGSDNAAAGTHRATRAGGAAGDGAAGDGAAGDGAIGDGAPAPDTDGNDDQEGATGTLLLGPGRLPERRTGAGASPRPTAEEETTIGQIPPISLASIGVLPFGDLAAGGDNARTRTDETNGSPRGHRGPTRGPSPGRRSR